MPLYRHECEVCGHQFRVLELQKPMTTATCPACGSERTHRLLSRVTVQFTGSGYYKTDHGRRGGTPETKTPAEKKTEPKDSSDAPSSSKDDN